MPVLDVATPLGLARAHVDDPDGVPAGVLVLGHGAGGGVQAPDLLAVTRAATSAGWRVIRVEQPWRVAGGRVAPAPARLDVGWLAVLAELAEPAEAGEAGEPALIDASLPLVLGGRSAGARVACRTAAAVGGRGVLALAFPLHPPGRPERSRAEELRRAGVPVLAVQGQRDPFGTPDDLEALGLAHLEVAEVPGDHSLARNAAGAAAVAAAAAPWLAKLQGSQRLQS